MEKNRNERHLQKLLEDDGLNIAVEYSTILRCNDVIFSPYQKLDNTFILSS